MAELARLSWWEAFAFWSILAAAAALMAALATVLFGRRWTACGSHCWIEGSASSREQRARARRYHRLSPDERRIWRQAVTAAPVLEVAPVLELTAEPEPTRTRPDGSFELPFAAAA